MSLTHARRRRQRGAVLDARDRRRRAWRRNITASRRLGASFHRLACSIVRATEAFHGFTEAYGNGTYASNRRDR